MKLSKLYRDKISGLDELLREEVIREAPHTLVMDAPDELGFLRGGFVDLGFENLGLDHDELRRLHNEFIGNGLAIPGTDLKLRYTRTGVTVVEPADGGEYKLPDNWADAVLVLADNGVVLYAGKLVRPDQLPP